MTTFRTLLLCVALLGGFGAAWRTLDRALEAREIELRARARATAEARQLARAAARSEGGLGSIPAAESTGATPLAPTPREVASDQSQTADDPSLTLTERIEHLARRVVGEAIGVSVVVDRFVEFAVVLEVPRVPPVQELAVWSRDLLRHTAPYLHSLAFVHGGKVLGAVDRSTIEAVAANWDGALVLLSRPLSPPSERGAVEPVRIGTNPSPGGATDAVARTTIPPGWLDPESVRAQAVHDAVGAEVQRGAKRFFEAVRELEEVVNRLGREGPGGLPVIREAVNREIAILPELRKSLAASGGQLEERLREGGFDETYRRAAVRTFRRSYPAEREAERMISQMRRYGEVLLKFLATMDKHRVEWTVLSEVQRIQFLDPDLFEVYRASVRECEVEQRHLRELTETWQKALRTGGDQPSSP